MSGYPGVVLRGEAWSAEEVEAIVADYFSMLEKELRRIPYSKTAHRKGLRPLLRNRSDGSIERKHQNISAILMEARFPYIPGYKPLSQYQGLLSDVVLEHLEEDAVLSQLAVTFAEADVEPPAVGNVLELMAGPPAILESVRLALTTQAQRRHARRVDYLAREARNHALGAGGEELVVSYERARLSSLGLDVLADRVEHVSVTRGDGLGYDVLSYSSIGRERFIEVKTTQLGPMTPFYVTLGELAFSREFAADYSLYRVYQFTSTPRMFSLDGDVGATCSLSPAQYTAVPR
ncbi:MAG TPA: DUF3883 domain-containing protein [Thermoanaerobaculia bacterium]|nr:DUF3883 domain-containing protein [Thermoanaerobaculia bacterium]